MNIHIFNETKLIIKKYLPLSIEKSLNTYFPKTKHAACSIILLSDAKITALNKQVFGKNYPTDVIAVHNPHTKSKSLGDVYICPKVIQKNAKDYSVLFNEEFSRVIIHGILHLLDYDHKKPFGKSKEKMFLLQEEILRNIKKK